MAMDFPFRSAPPPKSASASNLVPAFGSLVASRITPLAPNFAAFFFIEFHIVPSFVHIVSPVDIRRPTSSYFPGTWSADLKTDTVFQRMGGRTAVAVPSRTALVDTQDTIKQNSNTKHTPKTR